MMKKMSLHLLLGRQKMRCFLRLYTTYALKLFLVK